MKLIEDWKDAWRWFSVQAMAAAGALQVVWIGMPDDLKASIGPQWVQGITFALLLLGVFGRLVKQGE